MSDPYAQMDRLGVSIHLMHQRMASVIQNGPEPGSEAADALAEPDSLQARPFQLAGAFLASSLDHLVTNVNVIASRTIPAFSLMSLLRTAHETALNALWLVEASITVKERMERGVGAQFADYEERRKIENAMGRTNPEFGKLAIDRRRDFMNVADEHGMAKLLGSGELGPTCPLPSVVDLFNRYESGDELGGQQSRGEVWYRLYSAFAHGKQWHLLGAGQVRAKGTVAAIEADENLLLLTATRARSATERALSEFASHYGP